MSYGGAGVDKSVRSKGQTIGYTHGWAVARPTGSGRRETRPEAQPWQARGRCRVVVAKEALGPLILSKQAAALPQAALGKGCQALNVHAARTERVCELTLRAEIGAAPQGGGNGRG